jgi:hypothetical protein
VVSQHAELLREGTPEEPSGDDAERYPEHGRDREDDADGHREGPSVGGIERGRKAARTPSVTTGGPTGRGGVRRAHRGVPGRQDGERPGDPGADDEEVVVAVRRRHRLWHGEPPSRDSAGG